MSHAEGVNDIDRHPGSHDTHCYRTSDVRAAPSVLARHRNGSLLATERCLVLLGGWPVILVVNAR